MSEAITKGHPIGAFIILIAICALTAWGIGLMNSGGVITGAPAGVLLFLFGTYVILALGPGDDHA